MKLKHYTMSNSLKGALLSGLVFPGCGQYSQKHYLRGTALMLASLAGLIVIGFKVTRQSLAILDKIDLKSGTIDMTTILNAVNQADASSNNFLYRYASLLILSCWILGIVDAFMIGRKRDLGLDRE